MTFSRRRQVTPSLSPCPHCRLGVRPSSWIQTPVTARFVSTMMGLADPVPPVVRSARFGRGPMAAAPAKVAAEGRERAPRWVTERIRLGRRVVPRCERECAIRTMQESRSISEERAPTTRGEKPAKRAPRRHGRRPAPRSRARPREVPMSRGKLECARLVSVIAGQYPYRRTVITP